MEDVLGSGHANGLTLHVCHLNFKRLLALNDPFRAKSSFKEKNIEMTRAKRHFLSGHIDFKRLFARRQTIDSQELKEPALYVAALTLQEIIVS